MLGAGEGLIYAEEMGGVLSLEKGDVEGVREVEGCAEETKEDVIEGPGELVSLFVNKNNNKQTDNNNKQQQTKQQQQQQ